MNLYVNHNFTLLNIKRDLLQPSRNTNLGHKHPVSEMYENESLDHEMDFDKADAYLDCSSDFGEDDEKQIMLDFIRLRSPSEGRRFRRNACIRAASLNLREDPQGANEVEFIQ